MKCDKYKCIYEADEGCEIDGGACIGDMCEIFGECITCQEQEVDECAGLK